MFFHTVTVKACWCSELRSHMWKSCWLNISDAYGRQTGPKIFKRNMKLDCVYTLFVCVNVTTHIAANEISVFETIFAYAICSNFVLFIYISCHFCIVFMFYVFIFPV